MLTVSIETVAYVYVYLYDLHPSSFTPVTKPLVLVYKRSRPSLALTLRVLSCRCTLTLHLLSTSHLRVVIENEIETS